MRFDTGTEGSMVLKVIAQLQDDVIFFIPMNHARSSELRCSYNYEPCTSLFYVQYMTTIGCPLLMYRVYWRSKFDKTATG